MKKQIFAVSTALVLVLGCRESSKVRQASNEFSKLPPAVQTAVREKAPNAEIADVQEHRRDGQLTYVIQFRDPRAYPEMELAADGRVLKYEVGSGALGRPGDSDNSVKGASRFNLSALPVEVQKAIEKNAPPAEVVDIRRHDRDGKVVYEIEYAGKAPRPVVHIASDGSVVKELQTPPPK